MTSSERIGTIAWRYSPMSKLTVYGATEEEMDIGCELGMLKNEEFVKNMSWYGDPAYGSWPQTATQPIRDAILALMRGEVELVAYGNGKGEIQ